MRHNIEETASLQDFTLSETAVVGYEQACMQRIGEIQTLARKGLWGLAFFLLLSAGGFAVMDAQLLLPVRLYELLGPAPPVGLIGLALVVYCFSALLLALPRIVDGCDRYRGGAVIGHLAAFYAFYFYGRTLEVNFWAIFAAGILLLALEYIALLVHCRREIGKERGALARHRRLRR